MRVYRPPSRRYLPALAAVSARVSRDTYARSKARMSNNPYPHPPRPRRHSRGPSRGLRPQQHQTPVHPGSLAAPFRSVRCDALRTKSARAGDCQSGQGRCGAAGRGRGAPQGIPWDPVGPPGTLTRPSLFSNECQEDGYSSTVSPGRWTITPHPHRPHHTLQSDPMPPGATRPAPVTFLHDAVFLVRRA